MLTEQQLKQVFQNLDELIRLFNEALPEVSITHKYTGSRAAMIVSIFDTMKVVLEGGEYNGLFKKYNETYRECKLYLKQKEAGYSQLKFVLSEEQYDTMNKKLLNLEINISSIEPRVSDLNEKVYDIIKHIDFSKKYGTPDIPGFVPPPPVPRQKFNPNPIDLIKNGISTEQPIEETNKVFADQIADRLNKSITKTVRKEFEKEIEKLRGIIDRVTSLMNSTNDTLNTLSLEVISKNIRDWTIKLNDSVSSSLRVQELRSKIDVDDLQNCCMCKMVFSVQAVIKEFSMAVAGACCCCSTCYNEKMKGKAEE